MALSRRAALVERLEEIYAFATPVPIKATAEVITSLHNYKERKFADFFIKEAFPVAMQIAELMKGMEQNG